MRLPGDIHPPGIAGLGIVPDPVSAIGCRRVPAFNGAMCCLRPPALRKRTTRHHLKNVIIRLSSGIAICEVFQPYNVLTAYRAYKMKMKKSSERKRSRAVGRARVEELPRQKRGPEKQELADAGNGKDSETIDRARHNGKSEGVRHIDPNRRRDRHLDWPSKQIADDDRKRLNMEGRTRLKRQLNPGH
jgi:hypothetical protein